MDKLYVLIKVEPGRLEEILARVKQKMFVKEASAVTGSYDIIAKVEGAEIAKILSTVVRDIHTIVGITSTESLVAVEL